MTVCQTPLRSRLRRDLAARHARLDACFSRFDLTTRPGLSGFLAAHRTAFAAIRPAPGGLTGALLLDRMIAAIDADLGVLDHAPDAGPAPLRLTRSMAQDYVLLGSRLGSQLLRRRWAAARDPVLLAAGAYLSLPPMAQDWRAFCDRAGALPDQGTEADLVVHEAGQLFDLFLAAGQAGTQSFAAPTAAQSERTV
ncbi:hypothetical protein [Limimaricola hongkongensis]|uniref:Heme oxygenase n=1 Tax=Limimaricola hongkongensis DSM 17492 TaxID=1122180 RepID=A0A017HG12_9RHOB|nr:hypothetical protein [Limimaricola hongkongensis]EYD73058.1 hypothetical protein Lokhon_00583 [Limimaricola hongkongensis DSM 17492]